MEARKVIARAGRFDAAMVKHVLAWKHLWRRFDVHIQRTDPGFKLNVPMLLRLNMFHLLQAASPNSVGLDIGVPARGWTGEAYQGHIFWDELFIFPFFNSPHARDHALASDVSLPTIWARRGPPPSCAGFKGAMFPWQSGSDGQEETQALNSKPALAALGTRSLLFAAPRGQRDRL